LMETLSTWHKILFQTSRMPKNSMKIVLSAKKKLIRNKNAGYFFVRKCCNVIFRNRMIVMAGLQIDCLT
ncbi:TPA: hypothetical protein ACHX6S_001942, partial [Escherichia coli]